jgi:hypothetical protein
MITLDNALGILGLVVSIGGFVYGVYSHHQISQAFDRTKEAIARSEKAVGVARAAIQRAYGTMIGIKSALPETGMEKLELAINDGLGALTKFEKEEPLLGQVPPLA